MIPSRRLGVHALLLVCGAFAFACTAGGSRESAADARTPNRTDTGAGPTDTSPNAADARPDADATPPMRDGQRDVPPMDGGHDLGPSPDARTGTDARISADTEPSDALPPDATPPDAVQPDAAPPPPPPLLTEFMARNDKTLADADGDYSDFIELYNPGAAPFDLEGWHLTDDAEDPLKWTFPDVTLAAHRYLIVFASNKNRTAPDAELHTNFKLDGDGEYLALADPAGVLVQAFDAVPPQREDVSWGLPAEAEVTPLVTADSDARLRFLGPGEAQVDFSAPEFDDSVAPWSDSHAAVGFDRTELPESPLTLNDSVGGYAGTQGANGWSYGYRDPSVPGEVFTPFGDDAWDGNLWALPGEPPFTEINRLGGHPNGRAQGAVHWAIRRWTASGPGRVRVRGVLGTYGIYGDGTICRVLVDGNEVLAKHVQNDRKRYDLTVDVVAGTTVDFAIDPGIDGDATADRTLFTSRVELWDAGAADLGEKLGDSLTSWSATGSQGARGWWSGYWDRGQDADDFYESADFVPFPRDEGRPGPTDFWNGVAWDWPGGDPPWTFMDADFWHPNGEETGDEQWTMRRWRAPVAGDLLIRWRVAKMQNGGGGVTGHVFQNGAQLDFADIAGNDFSGAERFVVAYGTQAGDLFDFALDPRGRNGARDSSGDLSSVSAEIWHLGDLRAFIRSDVGRNGAGAAAVLVRVPFEVPDPGAFDRLRLSMRFDDGFEASLNGAPSAAENTGPVLDRSALEALEPVVVDLTERHPLLHAGTNLLALRGLQGPADDHRLLLAPRLEGLRVRMDPAVAGFLPAPTPGADNLSPTDAQPPRVETLSRWPVVEAGDPVSILASVTPGTAPIERVTVTTRIMFGPEETAELFDFGDGTWGAVLFPAAFPGQLVRWRVDAYAADGAHTRDPPFEDSRESEAWHGTVIEDLGIESNLPVLHWFAGRPEDAATDQATRGLLFWNGELYDNVEFSLHGQSTRGFPKHSYNVDFTSDHHFALTETAAGVWRVKDINLLSDYADKSKMRNTLAWETYRDAHGDHHVVYPVRVQLNGAFHGLYDLGEDGDDRWLERMGRNPEGALYKMYDSFVDIAAGEKKSRRDEGKADLEAFLNALNLSGDALRSALYDEVNLAAMTNFLAAMILTSTTDCCHKNYYAFRDTGRTDQWHFMIWDLDLSFGRNWTGGYFDDRMYPENPLYIGGNNRLTGPLFALPEFQEMYFRRLRTLMDTLLQPPGTPPEALHYEQRIDELYRSIGADGDRDLQAWPPWGEAQTFDDAVRALREGYLIRRRDFVYRTFMAEAGGPLPPPVPPLVVIDEADPCPDRPDEAYVRLTNLTGTSVDVSEWHVAGAGIELVLEPGAVLPTNGHLYVVANVPAFKARAVEPHGGQGLFLLGNWAGALDPDGDLPTLVDAGGTQVFP